MAILGIGTDIVEIERIEAVIARSGDRLAKRVLSDNEWAIWERGISSGAFSRQTLCRQRSGGKSDWPDDIALVYLDGAAIRPTERPMRLEAGWK